MKRFGLGSSLLALVAIVLGLIELPQLGVAALNYTIDCATFKPPTGVTGNTCDNYGTPEEWGPILTRQLPDWCRFPSLAFARGQKGTSKGICATVGTHM